jgi:SPP1 gp7 family putative phage head morphogenesis protein
MPVPTPQQALEYARKRQVVLPIDFYDPANVDQHGNLMTVSNLAGLNQIQAVTDDLLKSLENGETFEQWQQRVMNVTGVPGLPPGRTETIFRNYMQTAYNGGRWLNFEQNKLAIPYLMFSAVGDDRTTDVCLNRSGMIRKVDDPFWLTSSPPCHHRCRSTLIPLTAGQAKNRSVGNTGLNQPNPADQPPTGWGYKPNTAGMKKSFKDQFKERLKKSPSWIQKIIKKIFDWIS